MAKNKNKLHIALKKNGILRDFRVAQDYEYIQHLLETYHYYMYIGVWNTCSVLRIEAIESEVVQELLKNHIAIERV